MRLEPPRRGPVRRTNRDDVQDRHRHRLGTGAVELPRIDRFDFRHERGRVVDRLLGPAGYRPLEIGPPAPRDCVHPHVHRAACIPRSGERERYRDRVAHCCVPPLVELCQCRLLQNERVRAVRGIERELQRHAAATGMADHVGLPDPQMLEERERVAHERVDRDRVIELVAPGIAAAVGTHESIAVGERGLDHERRVRGRGTRMQEEDRLAVCVAAHLVLETNRLAHRRDP